MKWDFFIAYASLDVEKAEQLYAFLAPQARVFLDKRCLKLGDSWDEELARAQSDAHITIVLISSRTEAAYYQREEIAAAIAMARDSSTSHRVVPIYLDNNTSRAPYGLRIKQGLTVSNKEELALASRQLLTLLHQITGQQELDPSHDGKIQLKDLNAFLKNKEYPIHLWNALLGFQNENPSLIYQRQLCTKDYEPGTFTINEITTEAKFLYNPCSFQQWIDQFLNDEISLIKNKYPQFFISQTYEEVLSTVKRLLEFISNTTGQSLRQNIWYQEYSDILQRILLFVLVGDPDYELQLYPRVTYERKEFIFRVLEWLEVNKQPTMKDWLHISIAAGLLGVNEKSVHAATSKINVEKAINLKDFGLEKTSLVERVGEDLWMTARTNCRIDATEVYFHTLKISAGHRFNIAVFSNDYLETIVLLKYYDMLLQLYRDIEVDFIPRSITCGNDASYKDVQDLLANFPNLAKEKRFRIIRNGPKLGTVNLLKLHKDILDVIEDASLIEVRGARNYEMMQGINKETYFGFMVCREFSESVIGLFAEDTPLIFMRQLPGEKSFKGFRERHERIEKERMVALTCALDNQKKWEGGHLSEIDKWPDKIKGRYETNLKFYSNNAYNFHGKYGDYLELEVKASLNKFFGKVVVIGCGSGKEVVYVANRGCQVYGMDFSFEALTIARYAHPELYDNFYLEDMYNIDTFQLNTKFDGVIANAVFVHLLERNDMGLMLSKIKTRLSPRGLCFIRVLNKENVIEELDHHLYNDARWFVYYDEAILKQLATEAGFSIKKMDKRPHTRFPNIFWISLLLENRV